MGHRSHWNLSGTGHLAMNKKSLFTILFSTVTLIGCQSTGSPEWYTKPPVNDENYIYSNGKGRSLNSAKNSALSQINSQLWTQVDSDFSMNESSRTINEKSLNSSYIDNNVNTSTAQISFSGIEYLKSEASEYDYYVQARIKRETIVKQLISDIERIENQAKNRLLALKHQDKFIWWMDNQDPEKQLSDIQVRLAILSGMDKQIDVDVIYTPQLIKQVSETGSDILVRIVNSKNDLKSSDFLASKLAKHGVMTTKKRSKKVTHALTLTSEYRQDKIGEAFISTKLTQLKLINSQGKLIANNELISTANSLTSYKLSKEGAERHFSAQIDELGLWQAMGF